MLIGIALISAIAMLGVWRVPLRVSVLQGLMSDETQIETFRQRAALFGGDSDSIVYVATGEGARLFTPRTLNAIRASARALEQLPEIERVFSIVDLPRLSTGDRRSAREIIARTVLRKKLARGQIPDVRTQATSLRRYWPIDRTRQRRVDLATMRADMLSDPLASRLLGDNGNSHAMLIWLNESSDLHNMPQSGIRETIRDLLQQHNLGQSNFYCVGTLVIQDWMFHEALLALKLVLPVTAAVVALLVYLIFHRLSYVVLTLTIAGVAIIWTLGVAATVYGEITLLVAATPALVLIISTADTVHLTSAYVAELEAGLSREQAVRKVFRQVGGACLLTSATTLVGFLSLMVVPAVTVRQMALACAVGVASALLLALTMVPIALTVLKPPPTGTRRRSLLNRSIDAAVGMCQWLSLNYPRTVVVVHLLIVVAAAAIALQIEFDADLPGRFRPSHPLRQSIDFFNREVTGTTTIEVFLETEPERLLAPQMTRGLAEFERRLTAMPQVRDVVSITTLYRAIDQLVGMGAPDGLPETKAVAAATLQLVEQQSPLAAQSVIAPEAGLLRVAVQVTPTRVLSVLRCAERIETIAAEVLPPGVIIDSSGYCSIIGHAVRVVLRSQAEGFLICLASVTAVLMIGIRSIRLSLLALIPNILPLILLGAVLKMTFDVIDPDVLGIAIVSFGLAVDDTIHFLHRYDIEASKEPFGNNLPRFFEPTVVPLGKGGHDAVTYFRTVPNTGDRQAALTRTYRYTGRAIVRTTVILCLGLLPFALSGYLSIRMIGTYLVFVLGCAVLGDLLLLPALVLLFGKRTKRCSPRPEC